MEEEEDGEAERGTWVPPSQGAPGWRRFLGPRKRWEALEGSPGQIQGDLGVREGVKLLESWARTEWPERGVDIQAEAGGRWR